MKILKQGAEAIIYLENNNIIKKRIKKRYRIKEIDEKIIKRRTKSEARLLGKADNAPKIISIGKDKIEMEYIKGFLLKDVLNKLKKEKRIKICLQLGKKIKNLHDKDIIHGDLTTSNIIIKDGRIFFIDFGLSFNSIKIEDKAVDMNLIKKVLEGTHHEISKDSFENIMKGYSPSEEFITRFNKVESRGRYKNKNV